MRLTTFLYSLASQPRIVSRTNSYRRPSLLNCSLCRELRRPQVNLAHCRRQTFCTSTIEKHVNIHSNISVKEFAEKLNVQYSSVINTLNEFDYDTSNGIKTILDADIAELIADEHGFSVSHEEEEEDENVHRRPPIITIMGHVDHGKTTLLDYLRNTSVAQSEDGGITQRIGAFSIQVPPDYKDKVTFVDTPGHAAFNSMRARGAQLTDIVVLVIAADDGVMKQTKECLEHIREANVPLIVALNKIDKKNANKVEKICEDLLYHGVHCEGYGGNTKLVPISALKGTNVDELLSHLNSLAKEQRLKGSLDEPVEAIVMEVESSKKVGAKVSLLIKNGKVTKGKVLVAGTSVCKVRQMYNANGEALNEAFPSDPIQVLGWRSKPTPGDEVVEMKNETDAKKLLKKSSAQDSKGSQSKTKADGVEVSEDELSEANVETDGVKEINVIIKADVSGSLEALLGIISPFHHDHLKLNIIDASLGDVTMADIQLAQTALARIYCFNSAVQKHIIDKAKVANVPVKPYTVIYKLLDDLQEEIQSLLPYKILEHYIGEGDVLAVFEISGGKFVAAGCRVTDGSFLNSGDQDTLWRVVRNGEVVHEGQIDSLKRGKMDTSIVNESTECGVILKTYKGFLQEDKISCVKLEKVTDTFQWKL